MKLLNDGAVWGLDRVSLVGRKRREIDLATPAIGAAGETLVCF